MRTNYNDYMDVLKNTPGKDAIWGATNSWRVEGHVWASIDDLSSSRSRMAGALRNHESATIYIANDPEITSLDRLRCDGQVYRIESVYQDEDELVCDCLRIQMDDSEIVEEE